MPSFLCGTLSVTNVSLVNVRYLFAYIVWYFSYGNAPTMLVINRKGHTRSHSEHGS